MPEAKTYANAGLGTSAEFFTCRRAAVRETGRRRVFNNRLCLCLPVSQGHKNLVSTGVGPVDTRGVLTAGKEREPFMKGVYSYGT